MSFFQQWKSYEREVVPVDAHTFQREECRRAFYAGAAASFGLVLEATSSSDEVECEENLLRLQNELVTTAKDLKL